MDTIKALRARVGEPRVDRVAAVGVRGEHRGRLGLCSHANRNRRNQKKKQEEGQNALNGTRHLKY